MMITRFVLTLLIGLVVSLGTSAAFAETFKCKRYTDGNRALKNNNLEEYFPKSLLLGIDDWTSRDGNKVLTKVESIKKYRLLPNGIMIASMKRIPGKVFKTIENVRYKCDRTSLQLAAGLKNEHETKSTVKTTVGDEVITSVPIQSNTTNPEDDPFAKAKATCSQLGFTAGTEKYGICVLKIAGNSGSQIALSASKAETVSKDTKAPTVTIASVSTKDKQGIIRGIARDNVQVAEVLINDKAVRVGNDGSFEWSGFVPTTGKEVTIKAIDTAALSSTKTVSLNRGPIQQARGPRFDDLDPTAGKRVKPNSNALAVIVGISDYERTDAPAVYADKDAQYFHDYASLKLGVPDSNIKTMVNAKAEQGDVILAVKDWMRRSSKPGKTDVYVFFAGHGLASDDGEQMYLLPYDGRPRLLDDTAILRDRLFSDIASANPRSVTVFLDTCYSGTTRGTDMLIASRPIAIKALKQSIPDNFTVMTAAAGDQTAKPLEEAKHGMFSYFLMKGMEGEADQNKDNKITAGELHQYVEQNVVQQSSGSQTPELQGDSERVLVRFE